MNHSRVFILASQSLFAQGVQSLLSGQSGIEVIGFASADPGALARAQEASPDVVIIDAGGDKQSHLAAEVLEAIPGVKVIGLSLEDNRIHTYYQQMKQGRSVEDLLETIREPVDWHGRSPDTLRLLVLFQEHYGQRILDNIRPFAPETWDVRAWRAPSAVPPVVDDPLKFLPLHLPAADLVLSLGESVGVARILPSVVERVGARAVVAPIDNTAWLPDSLVRQLRVRLRELGVSAVFPKPFCSLTDRSYSVRQQAVSYEDPWIGEFTRYFGHPVFRIECESGGGSGDDGGPMRISKVEVERDAPCGCGRAVASQLVGVDVQEAGTQAGRCHHYYPCLTTMGVDPALGEPLIQASAGCMREAVEVALAACLSQSPGADIDHASVDVAPLPTGRGELF
jgi:hypothetical protein